MFVNGAQAAAIMQTAASLRRHPAFFGLSVVADEDALRRLGPQARGLAISQVAPYPWSETERQIADYREQARAAGVPIGYASLEGWLERAGHDRGAAPLRRPVHARAAARGAAPCCSCTSPAWRWTSAAARSAARASSSWCSSRGSGRYLR